MKSDDVGVLREVQRNTRMAMKALDALSGKIYDDGLSVQAARESMKYADIYNKQLTGFWREERHLTGNPVFRI